MPDDQRRSVLFGGERLRESVERPSGGGGKYHPVSFQQAVLTLIPQVKEVEKLIDTTPSRLRGSRIVLEATLLPNYLAPSYFPTPILEATGLQSIGSRRSIGHYRTPTTEEERPTKTLLLSGKRSEVSELRRILEASESTLPKGIRDAVVEFTAFSMPLEQRIVLGMRDRTPRSDLGTWEAVLHRVWTMSPQLTRQEQDHIFGKWVAHILSIGGEVIERYRRIVDGLTFVPVRLAPDGIPEAAEFNPLRAIRPMPHLRPIVSTPFRSLAGARPRPLNPSTSPHTDQRVAVFDGGIDPECPFMAPFVEYSELTPEPPSHEGILHGSAVTSAILYGYHDSGDEVDVPNVFVDHYRVTPVPTAESGDYELNWILDQIVNRVRSDEHRLVNLSLGPDDSIEDDCEPSRWTAELDALAREAGVLFVTAAGNNGENVAGLDRIQVPGDMANGLAVGAVKTPLSVAQFERAPYSARGPGRWGSRIQPLGVCFGGDNGANPFIGIGPSGQRLATRGTSFAAPLALHGLTDLIAELGNERTQAAHLLKAFAVHFAHRRKRQHEMTEVGFGLLRTDYRPVLQCAQHEVTVIYRDFLQRETVSGFTLPLPEGLDPDERIAIRWTLCYSSPIDPAEALDYTKAGVLATFRPHMRRIPVYGLTGNRLGVFDYLEEAEAFMAAVAAGGTPSSNPATDAGREMRLDEHRLRDAGKWETIVQHRFSRKVRALFYPRLDLTYYLRNGGALVDSHSSEDLPISLLVSLQASPGSNFYDLVRQEFDVLVPVEVEIQL